MRTTKLPPIHPDEILREEFLKPRGLSQNALARALNVPPRRINEIVLERRGLPIGGWLLSGPLKLKAAEPGQRRRHEFHELTRTAANDPRTDPLQTE